MEQHLVENTAQYIAVTFPCTLGFHRFGNGTAQASGCAGMLCKNLSADGGGHTGGRGNSCAIGFHNFPAEGFLLIGNFYHIDQAVQAEIGACHGQSGPPLTGAGFRRNAGQSLLFCVIGLGDGGIELVASACIVAFKFIINFGRRL